MTIHASKSCGALLVCLLAFAGGRPSHATIYNDGGTHTISGPDSDVSIGSGTTVNIVTGALDNRTVPPPIRRRRGAKRRHP